MNKPDIKLNPHPKMRYEITMTVEGAPGGFEAVQGRVDYHVSNPDSVPLTPLSGATVEPQEHTSVEFERVNDTTYKAYVYADRYLDEDYFGRGTCHWALVAVSANLIQGRARFSPMIVADDVFRQKESRRWFANQAYRGSPLSGPDIGTGKRSDYKQPDDTFSVTLQSTERTP
ncbi:hypothetical protein [Luteibacter sp. UNCMF331Sha3.1]|uniref:hypothetical protein n=1 Tax=Luteibacter sp. UNCMF331Sha3.1 TaxID=1502760 RepID=UPI000B7C6759|nr:hypothetical protein [Luteibacter sp. UNCMF331Sha3.1]